MPKHDKGIKNSTVIIGIILCRDRLRSPEAKKTIGKLTDKIQARDRTVIPTKVDINNIIQQHERQMQLHPDDTKSVKLYY